MKGIVFSEFNELVESKFGDDMLDDIINDCADNLKSGGSYTSVGTYDHEELVMLVTALSKRTDIDIPTLIQTFGLHLAQVFEVKFPSFFAKCDDCFEFFRRVDSHIHVEVKKLYPDAQLPKFTYDDQDPNHFILTYESNRHFSDLAMGLLKGVAQHFEQNIQIEAAALPSELGSKVQFSITK